MPSLLDPSIAGQVSVSHVTLRIHESENLNMQGTHIIDPPMRLALMIPKLMFLACPLCALLFFRGQFESIGVTKKLKSRDDNFESIQPDLH